MKEIAAMDLGGTADDYEIGDERVFKTADNSQGLLMQKPPGEPWNWAVSSAGRCILMTSTH